MTERPISNRITSRRTALRRCTSPLALGLAAGIAAVGPNGAAMAQTVTGANTSNCTINGSDVTCTELAGNNATGFEISGALGTVDLTSSGSLTNTGATGPGAGGTSALGITSTSASTIVSLGGILISTDSSAVAGDAAIDIDTGTGDLTVTTLASGRGEGNAAGMRLRGDDITLHVTGGTTTARNARALDVVGTGNVALDLQGQVSSISTAGGAVGERDVVNASSSGGDVSITTSGSRYIDVGNANSRAIVGTATGTNGAVTINNGVELSRSNGASSQALLLGEITNAANADDVSVTNTDTLFASGTGIHARTVGTGNVTVSNAGTITRSGPAGTYGILATATSGDVTVSHTSGGIEGNAAGIAATTDENGSVTVTATAAGTIFGSRAGGYGIDALGNNSVAGASGTQVGDVTVTTGANLIIDAATGIRARNRGQGDITVTNAAAMSAGVQVGIDASILSGSSGDLSVVNDGDLTTTGRTIRAVNLGTGTVSVVSNGAVETTAASLAAIVAQGRGDVSVVLGQGGSITTSATNGEGIYLYHEGGSQSDVDIDIAGSITASGAAGSSLNPVGALIDAVDLSAATTDIGTITVRSTGTVAATNGDALQLLAQDAASAGLSSLGATATVVIENGGSATGAYGIREFRNAVGGVAIDTTLDIGGALSGTISAAELLDGDDTVVLRHTANVTGDVDAGAGSDALRWDYAGDASFAAGLLTSQYLNFESYEKRGAGALTFTGSDSGTRTIALNGGTIYANAAMGGTAIVVGAGGTLGGSGTVGALTVDGTLAPGNSIGTINVTGDARFNDGSTFAVEIDENGNADKLVATGDVRIGSGLVRMATPVGGGLVLAAPAGPALSVSGPAVIYPENGLTYTVIEAGGSVTGSFATVTDTIPDIDLAATYNPQSVQLTYVKAPSSASGNVIGGSGSGSTGSNASIGGGGLSDKSAAPSVAGGGAMSAALVTGAMADGASALAAAGGASGAATTFSLDRPTDVGAFAADLTPGDEPATVAPKRGRLAAHAFAFGETMAVDAEPGLRGYDADAGGLGAGLRGAFDAGTGTVAVGVAGAVSRTETDSAATSSEADLYQASVDLAWSDGTTSLAGAVGYGLLDIETSRLLFLGGGTSVTALGATDGDAFSYAAEVSHDVGRALGLGAVVAPYARIEGAHLSVDGFVETGAGILNLAVADTSVDLATGELGLRLGTAIGIEGGTLRPTAEVAYQHALGDELVTSGSSIAAVAASFTEAVRVSDESSVAVGAGLAFERGNLAATVDYKGAFGSEIERHRGHLGLAVRF